MPRQLTAAELREPDVVIEILESNYHKLPANARKLIETYHHEFRKKLGTLYFRVAAYRWRDEIAPLLAESSEAVD